MQNSTICLVCYMDQDNLGVGYLASSLLETGRYEITLLDMRESVSRIVQCIAESKPLIVGFSIVFQAQMAEFKRLIAALRDDGVTCHFTAGGHYPSLRYEELMGLIPELDSIVLFEGEHTLVELARALENDADWRDIEGIAYRDTAAVRRNTLRPLEDDLDTFPLPVRCSDQRMILGHKVVNILAGRGCYYRCSFCSIQRFYAQPPGKVKRIRRPEYVAREIQLQYEQLGTTIFLFQDDDFPVVVSAGNDWAGRFCRQLRERNLADAIMWKMSCRVNEVDEAVLAELKSCGLGMVYLGIESGTVESLRSMNKRITPEDSLTAAGILKKLRIPFEFGFMMFDPYSTFESLRGNIDFLRRLCGDGSASAVLSRMLALAGTDMEDALRSEGRLFGQPPYEDYRFLDPRMDECYNSLFEIFSAWVHDSTGFLTLSRWVRLQVEAFRRFTGDEGEAAFARTTLHRIVSSANRYLLDTIEAVAGLTEQGTCSRDAVSETGSAAGEKHAEFCRQLAELAIHIDDSSGVDTDRAPLAHLL